MGRNRSINITEIVLGAALIISVLYGISLRYISGPGAFKEFVREDGFVEYATVFFLFAGSIVCLSRGIHYCRIKNYLPLITWWLLAFLLFFAAGDEISWGQRIFGIESGEFFLRHNKQAETNIHNLIVAGKSVNLIIFSRLVLIVLIIYFVLGRVMVKRVKFIRSLALRFAVPLPTNRHIILMFIGSVLIATINLAKGSELNELSFAVIFFMIFLNPVMAGMNDPRDSAIQAG